MVGRSFDNSVRFGMKQKRNSPILCNIQWAEIIFNNARATITFFVFIAILIPFSCLYQQQIVHQFFFFYFNKGERRVNRFPKLMRKQTCYISAHRRHGWWFFYTNRVCVYPFFVVYSLCVMNVFASVVFVLHWQSTVGINVKCSYFFAIFKNFLLM